MSGTIRSLISPTLAGKYALSVELRHEDNNWRPLCHDDLLETLRRVAEGRFKPVYRDCRRYQHKRRLVGVRLKDERDLFLIRLTHGGHIWRIKRIVATKEFQDDGPGERASSGVSQDT